MNRETYENLLRVARKKARYGAITGNWTALHDGCKDAADLELEYKRENEQPTPPANHGQKETT